MASCFWFPAKGMIRRKSLRMCFFLLKTDRKKRPFTKNRVERAERSAGGSNARLYVAITRPSPPYPFHGIYLILWLYSWLFVCHSSKFGLKLFFVRDLAAFAIHTYVSRYDAKETVCVAWYGKSNITNQTVVLHLGPLRIGALRIKTRNEITQNETKKISSPCFIFVVHLLYFRSVLLFQEMSPRSSWRHEHSGELSNLIIVAYLWVLIAEFVLTFPDKMAYFTKTNFSFYACCCGSNRLLRSATRIKESSIIELFVGQRKQWRCKRAYQDNIRSACQVPSAFRL